MAAIEVNNLVKFYTIFKKQPGFLGTLQSFFARKYEKVKAVDDISFKIKDGELVGFIGPNGAGKTTTLKCLSGLLYPTSGDISVLGYKPAERKYDFLKNIAFVMGAKNQLWWDLPPTDTFLLNKEIYEIDDHTYHKTLRELVDLLDVADVLKIQVKRLSLGQRMKCELIANLLHQPKILFLDEPTIGLDVVMQNNLREFIRQYNQRFNSTIILTSHYMQDVAALAKRVIIISNGKILFDGLLSRLVKKHAPYKLLSIVLKEPIDQKRLAKFGKIKSYQYPKLILRVSTKNSNKIAAQILSDLPVEDLNIEDADVEEVIREVFQTKK